MFGQNQYHYIHYLLVSTYIKKNITATHRLVFSEDPNIIALIELFIIKQFRETPYFQTISF